MRLCFYLLIGWSSLVQGQKLAVLHYEGGGDWYANPTSVPNLSAYYNEHFEAFTQPVDDVTPSELIQEAPIFLHATGHGRIFFSKEDREALRNFIFAGGFLHVDDNYGMSDFALEQLAALLPEAEVVSVPLTHPIFRIPYEFDEGLPKIHEHDNAPPQAIGYFINGELVALLTDECDLGDGWEDEQVHHDTKDKRTQALKMGANLVHWSLVRSTEP